MSTPHSRANPRTLAEKPSLFSPANSTRQATSRQLAPTILLVDDDDAVREGLRRVLQTEGWKVISAASGEEALEYLLNHQPDLMITDLSMAQVSGWDLLFHENLQRPNLPVFVVTALPLPAAGGADKFADEFFQKPLDFDVLLDAVRRCLGARRKNLE